MRLWLKWGGLSARAKSLQKTVLGTFTSGESAEFKIVEDLKAYFRLKRYQHLLDHLMFKNRFSGGFAKIENDYKHLNIYDD